MITKIKFSSALAAVTMFSLYSCHEYRVIQPQQTMMPQTLLEEEASPIHYKITFNPINSEIAGNVSGTGSIDITAENLSIMLNIEGTAPSTQHAQFIYSGTQCPTTANDTNGDGLVDAIEAQNDNGTSILTLNDKLSEKLELNGFPESDEKGSYFYQKTGIIPSSLKDLEGKTIQIHGVSKEESLPDTVLTVPGLTENASLPIACGVIESVADTGSVPEEDDIQNTPIQSSTSGGKGGK